MEIETVCLDPEENLTCSAFLFKIFYPFPFILFLFLLELVCL